MMMMITITIRKEHHIPAKTSSRITTTTKDAVNTPKIYIIQLRCEKLIELKQSKYVLFAVDSDNKKVWFKFLFSPVFILRTNKQKKKVFPNIFNEKHQESLEMWSFVSPLTEIKSFYQTWLFTWKTKASCGRTCCTLINIEGLFWQKCNLKEYLSRLHSSNGISV